MGYKTSLFIQEQSKSCGMNRHEGYKPQHGGEICRGRLSSLHNQWASDDRWCTRLSSLLPLNNILEQKKTNIGYTPSNSWGRSMIKMLFPHVGLPWYPHWTANWWSEVSKLIGTPNISDHTIAVVKCFHLPIPWWSISPRMLLHIHVFAHRWQLIFVDSSPNLWILHRAKTKRASQTNMLVRWGPSPQTFRGLVSDSILKGNPIFSVRPQCLQSKHMGSGFENS